MAPHALGPLICFINAKSGGQQGKVMFEKFKELMDPNLVYDLGSGGPDKALTEWKGKKFRILTCGGDGSIGWVLSGLDKLGFDNTNWPPLAILPLGTGNDISRTLEWGPGYEGEPIAPIINEVEASHLIQMDRWLCHMAPFPTVGETNAPPKDLIMNAYFGLGVDAEVALMFHEMRESNPQRFTNRTKNKAIYSALGVKAMVKSTESLASILDVELDGKPFKLPKDLQGFLVLNLPSWGGGKDPWGSTSKNSRFSKPCIDDGLVEIVGFKGVMHMGLIQSGMGKGKRLAQASRVKLVIRADTPVQVDGEPWLMRPSEVLITHKNAANMLFNNKTKAQQKKLTQMVRNMSVCFPIATSTSHLPSDSQPAVPVRTTTLCSDDFDIWNTSMRPKNRPHASQNQLRKQSEVEALTGTVHFDKVTLEKYYDHFQKYNINEIDKIQFVDALNSQGTVQFGPNEKLLTDRIFDIFDQDSNGSISFQEFMMGLSVLYSGSVEEKLRLGFVLFDLDNNGGITKQEMQPLLTCILGFLYKGTQSVALAALVFTNLVFANYDLDQDGYISFAEFVNIAEKDPRFAYIFTLGTYSSIHG